MIKVKLPQGVYEVVNTKSNMIMFNDKDYERFFVRCDPEESKFGYPMDLVDKDKVIEIINDEEED